MGFWEFIVTIIVLGIVGDVIRRNQKYKHSRQNSPLHLRDDRYEKLEERVRVLENIVSDRKYDLKKRFEDLEK